MEERLFLFEKLAVVTGDAQQSVRIGAVQLDHRSGDVFEKVSVVADHNGRERRGLEKLLQPFNGSEV
jgi:hypothetical protein